MQRTAVGFLRTSRPSPRYLQDYRAAGSVVPGQEHMGRGAAIRLVDKKPRPAPNFAHVLTKDTKASEGS
jgi:hypothetical protein